MRRILVIEDNAELGFGLRNNLEVEGYEVRLRTTEGELGGYNNGLPYLGGAAEASAMNRGVFPREKGTSLVTSSKVQLNCRST